MTHPIPGTDSELEAKVEEFTKLLIDAKNASFDCGEYDSEHESNPDNLSYNELYRISTEKKEAVIAFFRAALVDRAAAKVGANVAADEVLSLHRQLAAEKFRADQGWQRYEEANLDRNNLRAALAVGAPAETPMGIIPASVDLNAPGEVNEKLLAYLNTAAQPLPAPIAGDVEKDAWTTWELCQACVKTGFGPLEAQTLLNNLEAAHAAMLANSSSGEAG